MNRHRVAIYGLRNKILNRTGNKELFSEYFDWAADRLIENHAQNIEGGWNTEEIAETVKTLTVSAENIHSRLVEISKSGDREVLKNFLLDFILKEWEKKEQ